MSCDRCGNATQPMAVMDDAEMLCSECWKPELLAWLEANREAIEEETMNILVQRMVQVSSEIPDGVTVFYYPLDEVADDS